MRYYIIDSGDGTQFRTLSDVKTHLYNLSETDRLAEKGNIICYMEDDKIINERIIRINDKGRVIFSKPLPDYYIR